MRVRALFLDVGDTLVYAHPSAAEIMATVCAEAGLPIEAAQIEAVDARLGPRILAKQSGVSGDALYSVSAENSRRFWMWVYAQILEELAAPLGVRPQLAQGFHDRFSAMETWRLFPDAAPLLEELHRRRERGLVVGVVSNWEDWLEALLIRLEVDRYFDFMVGSAIVRSEKPDPAIFRAALERAQTRPEETLHVGDSLHADIGGARACGITPVLLDRRGRYSPEETGGASIIRSLAELPPLLDHGPG